VLHPPSHHKTEDTSDFSPEQETANSQSKNLPIVLEDMPAQQKSNPHNCLRACFYFWHIHLVLHL
jgi:hypothetical protein